jgi:outer membrane protein OmpA-like peptidoglycan-associated protein
MRSFRSHVLGGALVLGGMLGTTTAQAQELDFDEPWFFTLDGGVSGPIDNTSFDLFNLGGDGGVGVFKSLGPIVALGARIRAGALSEGGGIPQLAEEYGVLDYGYLGAAIRIRPFGGLMHDMGDYQRGSGLYLDLGPGAAILDGDVVPAYEAAIGYNFGLGPISIGPKFRFTHMIEVHDRFATAENIPDELDNDVMGVMTWTGGLEMTFNDRAEPELPPAPRVSVRPPRVSVQAPRPAAPSVAIDQDRDNDGILGTNDRCPDSAESWNGHEDDDGCPDEGVGQFANDALVVDERVFFDFDSDELRPAGREQLDVVSRHYEEWGNRYDNLVISGHTDSRGTDEYNEGLSRRRAEVVMDYLKERGVPANVIRMEGLGESDPEIAAAESEFEHQVNRRVEFRVEWRLGMRPEGIEPTPNPTMPDYVDPAPRAVQEREARIAERERREAEGERAEAREGEPSEPVASAEEREEEAREEERRAER